VRDECHVPCFAVDHIFPTLDGSSSSQQTRGGLVAGGKIRPVHPCADCSATFTRVSDLKRHAHDSHPGDDNLPLICDVCSQQFAELRTLKQHKRVHSDERPYHCILCEKKFTQPTTLTRHLRTHTGERPYGCAVCSMRFISSTALKRHLNTHSLDRPTVTCAVCQRQFAQQSYLKVTLALPCL